jgi:tryptophan-rich sensory protein
MFNSVWYKSLVAPTLTPPDFVFPLVWGFLYFTILISFIFFLFANAKNKKFGYMYFFIRLGLNFLWTPIFFLIKNIGLALIVIILLDIFLVFTIKNFYKISKFAGLILLPYLLWVCFATYLNFGYWVLNF